MIILWFLQSKMGGGTTTYTVHLAKALRMCDQDVRMIRIDTRSPKQKSFGEYGENIWNYSPSMAIKLAKSNSSIITAIGEDVEMTRALLKVGARAVLHDATQLHSFGVRKFHRPICIRQAMRLQRKEAIFIPHPYVRTYTSEEGEHWRKWHAISLARVHTQKRSLMLVKANERLSEMKRIRLLGKEFRLYSYGLQKRYPHYRQSGKQLQFPLTLEAAPMLAYQAKYNVDMSYFKNDGGGSQYSQLEAMDAGCINIMHEDWFRYKGTLSKNAVLCVTSVEDITALLNKNLPIDILNSIRAAGYNTLHQHDPKLIGNHYIKELRK